MSQGKAQVGAYEESEDDAMARLARHFDNAAACRSTTVVFGGPAADGYEPFAERALRAWAARRSLHVLPDITIPGASHWRREVMVRTPRGTRISVYCWGTPA